MGSAGQRSIKQPERPSVRFFLFFCLFLAGAVSPAPAAGAPDWVTTFPKETAAYKFYVGRGTASSETEAIDKASKNVYEQALKMNFGVQMQMNAETYQTEREARLTERFVEESALVRFNDFEQIDQYIKKSGGKYSVWVLYRFSKDAIRAEKKRLAELPEQHKKDLSVIGSTDDRAKGVLEIETKPADGVDVYIDGERFGQTPLRLIGALETGTHLLRLESPLFDTVEEDVIIIPRKTVKVSKTLKRAFAELSVSSLPKGAEVRLNGRRIGKTPLKTKALCGEKIQLSLRHPETEESIQFLTPDKNDNRDLYFELIEKPAKLSVFSFPEGASVLINGEKAGETPLRAVSLQSGKHSVLIEKKGFEDQRRFVVLKGGDTKSETFTLSPEKKSSRIRGKTPAVADRHRKYEETLPAVPAIRLTRHASADDAVKALLKWDFPLAFIRASVSRLDEHKNNTFKFFVHLTFDEDLYKRYFVARASEILTPFSTGMKEKNRSEECSFDNKTGAISCKTDKIDGHDMIYIRSGKTEHGFLSDEAPYKAFQVYTATNWPEEYIENVSPYKVRFDIFNADGQKTYSEDLHFSVRRFVLEKNQNIMFSPAFYVQSRGGDGTRELLLATELQIEGPIDEAVRKVAVKIMADEQ